MKNKLLIKWIVLIWLNSLSSFILALANGVNNIQEISGMIIGVFSFVLIYQFLDLRLFVQREKLRRKLLFIGVLILSVTQLFPAIQFIIGMFSLSSVNAVIGKGTWYRPDLSFFDAFIVTLLSGLLLSIVLAIIISFLAFLSLKVFPYFKGQKCLKWHEL